jgi:hypothetical protein
MRYGSLFRMIVIQMVVVFVMFFVVPAEAFERGGGGRGGGGRFGGFSREGEAREVFVGKRVVRYSKQGK